MLPTTEEVRELGARLVGPSLILFPVRHHSPACAWHLRRLLAGTRPSAVLVEGPRSFTRLIPQIVHDEARMPLAVYTYAVERARGDSAPVRHAAYHPFCDHSPELVALRHAQLHGIPSRFIDLDLVEQRPEQPDPEDVEAQSLLDERHFKRSRYLSELASRLGCRDHDELWEHLFEAPATARSLGQHVGDIAAYCHLARIECSDAELSADGTLAREAEMAFHVREALGERGEGDGPVLAVVGGFHALAIHALLEGEAARPKIARPPLEDEASALIRYSFDRLDRLNGYSAGMTSPAWWQRLWERMLKHEKAGVDAGPRVRRDVALSFLLDIAVELRLRGVPLPMPTVGAAYDQALRLAALRRRAAPLRDDVIDALTSCFVKGDADADGALILAAARATLSGKAMGQVPPGADTPPLVRDFHVRARRQRLRIDDSQPRKAALDIYRRPEHRTTSRLFHGLALLGVPFGTRVAGPDFVRGLGLERLQEHWQYAHSAATEAALVEASVFGATLPRAVAARFGMRIDRADRGDDPHDARAAAALLTEACVLGLHDHVPRVAATLARAIGGEADFASAATAAGALGLLWESREPLEAREIRELKPLLRAAYERALYLGGDVQGASGDGSGVVDGLLRLRELLASDAGSGLDGALYGSLLEALHASHCLPLIRGAAAGLLHGAGRLSEAALGKAIEGHLDGLLAPQEGVAFLRGLLQTAREAAWQQPALLTVLDRLLARWDDAGFVAALPELRLAFAEMTPKETDRIAEAVAGLHGGREIGGLIRRDISPEEVQASLALSQQAVDILRADGLSDWLEP